MAGYEGKMDYGAGYEALDVFRPRGRLHRRPVTDYGSSVAKWVLIRQMGWRGQNVNQLRPNLSYIIDLLPPAAYMDNPAMSLCTKHAHASLNKIKHPINVVKWTPEGRRLLTGSSSGEFTLWNGMGFNFETIMQAHDCAIRVCEYSHGDDWLLSGDQDGIVKYWQPNFNNVKVLQAHSEPVRDLSFAPTDAKFVTASDDGTLRIWNFNEGVMERSLSGHGWDVKCVDWHPTKGLIVSGSKDHLVKLWDPRTARCLTTLHGHKNTITKSKFQPTRGELLATSARDQTCRIFDLRMMKDLFILRGHEKDISTLAWHPAHPSLISTGGSEGSLNHYLLDEGEGPTDPANSKSSARIIHPAHSIPYAHEFAIWSMEYHPMGHILCTGSNDRITRFWIRPRPNETDAYKDRYHIGEAAAEALGTHDRRGRGRHNLKEEEEDADDEADALIDQKMPIPGQQPTASLQTQQALSQQHQMQHNQDLQHQQQHEEQQQQQHSAVPLPIISGFHAPNGAPGAPPSQSTVPGLGELSALMASGQIPPGLPFPGLAGIPPPPVPQGTSAPSGSLPSVVPGMLPPGLVPPLPIPGFSGLPGLGGIPPPPGGIPGLAGIEGGDGGSGGGGGSSIRNRVPLPSQEESLQKAKDGGRAGADPRRRR